jgi:hypothetical protein
MKSVFVKSVLVLAAVFSLNSYAVSAPAPLKLWCKGLITQAYIDKNGNVLIYPNWRNDYIMICNMNSSWKGISTVTCAAMYSTAISSIKSGLQTVVLYADGVSSTMTCANLKTYDSAPLPFYLMLVK